MAAARMSASVSGMGLRSAAPPQYSVSIPTSAAIESAVDAYATRLLRLKSPPEACIDDSLGPYVTSMLRCSLPIDNEGVESLPEYSSLLELLEEHCNLSEENARSALESIAKAVRTGVMERDSGSDVVTNYRMPPTVIADVLIKTGSEMNGREIVDASCDQAVPEYPAPFTQAFNIHPNAGIQEADSPLKPDNLIPLDLLGVLDDPPAATEVEESQISPDPFPPLGSMSLANSDKPSPSSMPLHLPGDLASSLFLPSQSRQQSIDEDFYSGSLGSSTIPREPDLPRYPSSTGYAPRNQLYEQQLASVSEMILSMNPDVCEEAALEAAALAGADINVAQYIIDGALSAPPVCRHMLNDGCYRSDCQFSHDVEGHTCLFWLRGRCGKRETCRFRHGFSEKLLDGLDLGVKGDDGGPINSIRRPTQAATQHPANQCLVYDSQATGYGFSRGLDTAFASNAFGTNGFGNGGRPWNPALESRMASVSNEQSRKPQNGSFSFASVAAKGYADESFLSKPGATKAPTLHPTQQSKPKFVKIPQDLWNPHVNRNAAAFHIVNPIERYKEVSKYVTRDDVIDLHFQSTKTFSTVLASILPLKLRKYDEVWVVTGSGHHVARSTHQKGGGALESAVLTWLENEGHNFLRGRDRNGHSGAILVKR